MSIIRTLIVDDHAILREGLRAILKGYPEIEVVGEAANGFEAVDKTRKLKPDVILMDIAMPELGGLEATLEIKKFHPRAKILILTQYQDKEYILRFVKIGVSGYILKKAIGQELYNAIKAVMEGGMYIDPNVAPALVDSYITESKKEDVEDIFETLTDREKQVLKLIAEGYTSKEVAGLLNISVKTVIGHRTHLMEKLNIHNRSELVRFAFKKRLIE
ncbi:MAG: response regulator transcription factor [Deltaproteobacteria bacterium]|nr:response regulator transcription factor [Deltaproteobacteria bacterium]